MFSGANNHDRIRQLLAALIEIPVDRAIAEAAGSIRQRHHTGLPDALIAATAVTLRLPLLTRNLRHLEGIKGLKVRAPG